MYITAYIQVPLVFPCAFHFLMLSDQYPGRLTIWNYKYDAQKNRLLIPSKQVSIGICGKRTLPNQPEAMTS